jgi:hypothetical protein
MSDAADDPLRTSGSRAATQDRLDRSADALLDPRNPRYPIVTH